MALSIPHTPPLLSPIVRRGGDPRARDRLGAPLSRSSPAWTLRTRAETRPFSRSYGGGLETRSIAGGGTAGADIRAHAVEERAPGARTRGAGVQAVEWGDCRGGF